MTETIYCACGCGNPIVYKPHHKYYGFPKYLRGHHQRGKTAATCPYIAAMAKKLCGRTKENDPSRATQAKKLRGRTAATHPSIATRAEKQRGKTKENDPGRAAQANKIRGRTATTNLGIAIRAEKIRGRTAKDYPDIARSAEIRRGRTKETHPNLASRIRGKTKENDVSIAARAEKMRGRTKETHLYIAEVAKRQSGAGNPRWLGGISFEPYTSAFNEDLKETIRQRDEFCCQKCGVPQIECITKLAVHHIDYDKANSIPSNLISLCIGCNSLVNSNREYWINYFQFILKGRELWLSTTI
ncbi:HNH endonuclease [Patescibacteria group bacterium]|nr:HNH endonuclease [Patescibacteria group bacterium]